GLPSGPPRAPAAVRAVRAFGGELLRAGEAEAGRRAHDERRATAQPEIQTWPYVVRTPTTSRTASALAFSADCSSPERSSSTICSIPPAPSLHGTPMYRPSMPY